MVRRTCSCSSLLGPCFPAALSFSPILLTASYVSVNFAEGILNCLVGTLVPVSGIQVVVDVLLHTVLHKVVDMCCLVESSEEKMAGLRSRLRWGTWAVTDDVASLRACQVQGDINRPYNLGFLHMLPIETPIY